MEDGKLALGLGVHLFPHSFIHQRVTPWVPVCSRHRKWDGEQNEIQEPSSWSLRANRPPGFNKLRYSTALLFASVGSIQSLTYFHFSCFFSGNQPQGPHLWRTYHVSGTTKNLTEHSGQPYKVSVIILTLSFRNWAQRS